MANIVNDELVNKIASLLESARTKIAVEVNSTLLATYMEIGKSIVEDELLHRDMIIMKTNH